MSLSSTDLPPESYTCSPTAETGLPFSSRPATEPFDPRADADIKVKGHLYRQGVVSGGRVQFGDIYHINHGYRNESGSQGYDTDRHQKHIYLPPRHSSPYFTGRVLQLQQIHSSLLRSLTGVYDHKVVVIYGIGGSGKTQFCLRYCEEHRER